MKKMFSFIFALISIFLLANAAFGALLNEPNNPQKTQTEVTPQISTPELTTTASKSTAPAVIEASSMPQVKLDIIKINASKPSKYRVFYLDSPARLVIDLYNAKFADNLNKDSFLNDYIKNVRIGNHANTVRLVFDLKNKISFSEHKIVSNDPRKMQLVIDLGTSTPIKPLAKPEVSAPSPEKNLTPQSKTVPEKTSVISNKTETVAPAKPVTPDKKDNATMQNNVTVSAQQLKALIKKSNNTNDASVPVVKAFQQ